MSENIPRDNAFTKISVEDLAGSDSKYIMFFSKDNQYIISREDPFNFTYRVISQDISSLLYAVRLLDKNEPSDLADLSSLTKDITFQNLVKSKKLGINFNKPLKKSVVNSCEANSPSEYWPLFRR